jgi:hypothetical protein
MERPSDQVVGLGVGGGQGRPVQGVGADVNLGAAVQGQVGQDPAEQGSELEAVGRAQADQDVVMAREEAEGEVAIRSEGVEAGRGVVVGAGGREAGPEEPGQAGAGGRVGVEAAAAGGDLGAADVLGRLEGGGQTGKP